MVRPGEEQEPNQSPSLFKAFRLAIFLAVVCACLSTSLPPSFSHGGLQITFIDVGQGDAAWIKTPDGWDILIDGRKKAQGPDLVSYLQGHGVTDMKVLILSHPHADHAGGLVTVLEDMDVDQALMNCQAYSSTIYQTYQGLLTNKGIPTTCVRDGDTFSWGSYISAAAVNPPEPLMSETASDANNNSIVLRITYGSIDFLFTGDVQSEAEAEILDRGRTVEAEILKLAHHGSQYSSTDNFLSQVDPEVAIISVGASNPYGHAAAETLQRLEDAGAIIYRTDLNGTIVVTTDGTTYSVEAERSYFRYLPLVLKAWSATPTPTDVRINPACSQFNAPGNDQDNLSEEYVCFTNWGGSPENMTDWKVLNEANHTYTFPTFVLAAGASVTLHSGSGTNTATDLYWGSGSPIWTNTGDTVYLYDSAWNLVDSYSYTLPPGTWTPGTLEIHILKVGQGESQLIIGPSGRTLLIGVKEASWNTNQGAVFVADEIRRIAGGEHLNYVMPSHWHLDHIGYAGYGGIWSLLEQQGITADVLIDRDGGVWMDSNNDGICDPNTEIVWHNAGTVSGTGRNWACWATDPTTVGGQIRELAQVDSTTQIDLGITDGVTVKIAQVDAEGVTLVDGVTPIQGDHTNDNLPPSENDYSITLWINWGKFDYVTGGDTDGEYITSQFGYTYNDVESDVAQRINQEVEVIWVNHHGSEHSTNATYVSTLNPTVAIYGIGDNPYGHPDQRVLDILFNNGTKQYLPEMGNPDRDYYDAVIVNDEVVVQVTDGISYTVNRDPYAATDTTPPSGPRVPAVGEVLINEFLPAPSTLPNEWVELYNITADELTIGGMYIDDIAEGGGAPKQIPDATTIAPGGFYVMTFNAFLNNTGDDVRLLCPDQATVHDVFTYSTTSYDLSYCRLPDGGPWSENYCSPTKSAPN